MKGCAWVVKAVSGLDHVAVLPALLKRGYL